MARVVDRNKLYQQDYGTPKPSPDASKERMQAAMNFGASRRWHGRSPLKVAAFAVKFKLVEHYSTSPPLAPHPSRKTLPAFDEATPRTNPTYVIYPSTPHKSMPEDQ